MRRWSFPPATILKGISPRLGTLLKFLAVMGPGLITANAGNDSGGIATYSAAGAQFVFFAYPVSAWLARPDWGAVARRTVIPTFPLEHDSLFMAITLIGTTITSYMQFFLQATIAEKNVKPAEYKCTRADVVFSA